MGSIRVISYRQLSWMLILLGKGLDLRRLTLCYVDTSEDIGGLRDTWESFVDNFCWEMAELEVDVVFIGSTSSSFYDFHAHGPGDDVARCEVFSRGCVSFHEAFALCI